jgi:hypothetical protein
MPKTWSEYHKNRKLANPEKVREENKRWRKNHPDQVKRARSNWYKRNPGKKQEYNITYYCKKYGIEKEQYLKDLKLGCFYCGSKKKLCIDHDKVTGKYRGILCHNHNAALGKFGDGEKGVYELLQYLRRPTNEYHEIPFSKPIYYFNSLND